MEATIAGVLGAFLGLAVMRRAARKQLVYNEALLQRDTHLLAMLPEDSEHRAEIRERLDRGLDIDAGRPDTSSIKRGIRQYAIGGTFGLACCVFLLVDVLRTADELSDLVIGAFGIGLTGAVAAFSILAIIELLFLGRRGRVSH